MDTAIPYETPETDGYNALGPVEARPLAGDTSDDDAQYVEEILTPRSDGVVIGPEDLDTFDDEFVDAYDWTRDGPKPTTRIISGTTVLIAGATGGSLGSPIMILPADPNRVSLRFRTTAGAPDIRWSDELQTCYSAGMHADTDQPVDIAHTGALWILPISDDPTAYVHYHSVTRNV